MLKCSGDCGSDGNLIGSLSGDSDWFRILNFELPPMHAYVCVCVNITIFILAITYV